MHFRLRPFHNTKGGSRRLSGRTLTSEDTRFCPDSYRDERVYHPDSSQPISIGSYRDGATTQAYLSFSLTIISEYFTRFCM